MAQNGERSWFSLSSALSILAGVIVLAALVWKTGVVEIRDGFLKVGWVFPVIVALGGLRFFVRAWAWTLCVDPPHRLSLPTALTAVLAGDALGNATPLGPVVGEPAKVAFARGTIATEPAATALAIENLFYTLSTAAMIAAGTGALLWTFELPVPVREYSELGIAAIAIAGIAALLVLRARPAIFSRWIPALGTPGGRLHGSRDKLHALEQNVYSFASRRSGRVLPIILLELGFHALGVLETHVTMWMILPEPPTLLTSFILETASRLITVAFKFIPLQLGVAEGGLAVVTVLLGLGETPGVTFALVRKARVAVWLAIGAGLLLRRGITPKVILGDTDLRTGTHQA